MMERRWPDLWAMIRSLALLIALGISIVTTHSSNPAATGLALAAVAAGWLTWTLPAVADRWLVPGLVVAGLAGIVLWYVNPRSAAFAFPASPASGPAPRCRHPRRSRSPSACPRPPTPPS